MKDLENSILDGINKKTVWVPFPFPKMSKHTGIGQRIYTLIGGHSGTGKTAFLDVVYVLKPYEWLQANETDIEIRWIYRSMERSAVYKKAKWACYKLWMDYKILMDVPTLLGWGSQKSKVTNEIFEKVKSSRDYFEKMFDYVELVDGPINPTGIYKHVKEYALFHGKIEEIPYLTKDGIHRKRRKYIPKNDKLLTIIIEDHIGKLRGEKIENQFAKSGSKEIIDKMSDYNASEFRDFYGFSPIAIMQFNRGLEGSARGAQLVKHEVDLSPLPTDFKGSGNIYEDADMVFGLYNPFKVKDMNHMGYKIQNFVDKRGYNRFRSITCLKNSYGIDDVSYGLNFLGECGALKELPKAEEITDYSKYTNIV